MENCCPGLKSSGNYSFNQHTEQSVSNGFPRPLPTNYPGQRANINVRQPLFDLQAYLLMKSQQSRTSQGEEELLAAHQQLIFDLVDRYINALKAADKSQIIAAELSSTEKQLNSCHRHAGASASPDYRPLRTTGAY